MGGEGMGGEVLGGEVLTCEPLGGEPFGSEGVSIQICIKKDRIDMSIRSLKRL